MAQKLTDKIFHDEDAARVHFEQIRWPEGRTCPHCGTVGNSTLLKGKSTRPGLYKCKDCRKPFTATMGTIYERSHIPLHKWLLATHLMVSSKKGISAMQLHRNLGFGSYRTAWFMAHRIREAMRSDDTTPMGQGGGGSAPITGLPPALAGMVASLAAEGPGWSAERRNQFVTALRGVIDFCFPVGVAPAAPAQATEDSL